MPTVFSDITSPRDLRVTEGAFTGVAYVLAVLENGQVVRLPLGSFTDDTAQQISDALAAHELEFTHTPA